MNSKTSQRPVVVTIAGSDAGGGAGAQGDLLTFFALGVHGASVTTALTAQSPQRIAAVTPVDASFVRAQLDVLASDLDIRAAKVAMVGSAENIDAIADFFERHPIPFVLDPIIRASDGTEFLSRGDLDILRKRLVPMAALITPNLDEVELMTGRTARDPEGMQLAGQALVNAGARAVLVKGGHLRGDARVDVLVNDTEVRLYQGPRLQVGPVHGTGCALSAAICAFVARGKVLEDAVEASFAFVADALRSAYEVGPGPRILDPSSAA